DTHRLPLAQSRVVKSPQLRALFLRVPTMLGAAQREDTLLGATLLLVAPRPAKRRVAAVAIERLLQRFGFHDRCMQCGARGNGTDPARSALLVDVHQEIEPEFARGCVAEGDHLAEFPAGVDVQKRKWQLGRSKRLAR